MIAIHLNDLRNKWLRGQIAALRGTHHLAVLRLLFRRLRSVRLALYPARSLIRCIFKISLGSRFQA